jgi:hypothetical protein
MSKVMLREIAHSRAGDKGDISNVSVIPYEEKYYELLKGQLTESVVANFFKDICFGKVKRYEFKGIKALNFVFENALDGGNTRSLRVDGYGKSLSSYILAMHVDLPD